MGDHKKAVAKARMELEELYSGIPDDSVNLTFEDLAKVKHVQSSSEMKKAPTMEPILEAKSPLHGTTNPLHKLPSLDFSRGLEATRGTHHHHGPDEHHDHLDHHYGGFGHGQHGPNLHHNVEGMHGAPYGRHDHRVNHHGHGMDVSGHNGHGNHHMGHHGGYRHGSVETSVAYDDVSVMSMNSMYQERPGARIRRPGIPHSKICTICSTYIYIFRHRCLVCGRVYCRNCVNIGMGEMQEGRKCIECLGKRFSARYIQRAGQVGCCSRYPSSVKQAELKWAEKGPRRTGERAYGQSTMMSRSRSPIAPRSPRAHDASGPPSFVATSPFAPYSPGRFNVPL